MSAVQLDDLLQELRAELRVRDNPERRALNSLGFNRHGGTAEPYSEEAFRIWSELWDQYPDDPQTLHHLVIMYHARAFDLEFSEDPSAADADWQWALQFWHAVWSDDSYWRGMTERGHFSADLVVQARDIWPEQLLQVHFDMALDERGNRDRARNHIQWALSSQFPRAAKDRVRQRAYDRVTGALPPAVWERNTFDPRALGGAVETVASYLDLDEDFRPALADLVHLLAKSQTSHVQQINASGDAKEFQAKLGELQALKGSHDERVRRLEGQLALLEPEVIADLVLWNARLGQSLRISEDFEEAAVHYRRAYLVAKADSTDDARQDEMRREWLLCMVLVARREAAGDGEAEERAKKVLAEIDDEKDIPPGCLMIRANAWMLMREFDAAERDCMAAESLLNKEDGVLDPKAAVEAAELLPQCRELLANIRNARRTHLVSEHLRQAKEAMENDRWQHAVKQLGAALAADAGCLPAYFLRAQCRMRLLELAKVRDDLQQARRLAQEGGDAPAQGALDRLEGEYNKLSEQVDQYGGGDAFRLQQRAAEAFNKERYKEAAGLLEQAISVASSDRRQKLRAELGICRNKQMEEAFSRASAYAKQGKLGEAGRVCHDILQECADHFPSLFLHAQCRMGAGDYDGADQDLRRAHDVAKEQGDDEALKAVKELRGHLDSARKAFAEYGGAAAFALHRRAVEEFEKGDLGSAASLLREAIEVADWGGDQKLKQELSICLTNQAFLKLKGSMGQGNLWSSRYEIRRLLEEAAAADPNNVQAIGLLSTLR